MKSRLQTNLIWLTRLTVSASLFTACGPAASDRLNAGSANSGSNARTTLYVASGGCYGGGVALTAGSGTIAAFDSTTGALRRVVLDYTTYSPGDVPVSISDYDSTRLLVTVENASGRRLDLVNKDGSGSATFLTNSTALSGVLRAAQLLTDGSVLVSKSTMIEKFAASKSRITQGANAYIQSPASTCATTATLIDAIATTSNGKILYAHSAVTPNNKVVMIAQSGYSLTTDCLATQAAPTTLAMPTALLVHSSGDLLVAYGSTTIASNTVHSYKLNITTNAITAATQSYYDGSIVNGPSAITENPTDSNIFVANALSTMNTIERFSYNPTTQTMTRVEGRIGPNLYTKCVSAMKAIAE